MSDAKGQQEPSMEEILASIRRIISEDSDADALPARPQPAPEPKPQPAAAPEPSEPEPIKPEAADADFGAFDDTEPAQPAAALSSSEDVLDLTEMVSDDGSVVPLAGARAEPQPESAPEDDLAEALGAFEQFEEPEPAPEPAAPPRTADAEPGAPSLDAFEQLQRAVQAKKERPAPPPPRPAPAAGGLTVEQLVSEAIKPMVREWLDDNLQPIVERMVAREIKRIASQQDE